MYLKKKRSSLTSPFPTSLFSHYPLQIHWFLWGCIFSCPGLVISSLSCDYHDHKHFWCKASERNWGLNKTLFLANRLTLCLKYDFCVWSTALHIFCLLIKTITTIAEYLLCVIHYRKHFPHIISNTCKLLMQQASCYLIFQIKGQRLKN